MGWDKDIGDFIGKVVKGVGIWGVVIVYMESRKPIAAAASS